MSSEEMGPSAVRDANAVAATRHCMRKPPAAPGCLGLCARGTGGVRRSHGYASSPPEKTRQSSVGGSMNGSG